MVKDGEVVSTSAEDEEDDVSEGIGVQQGDGSYGRVGEQPAVCFRSGKGQSYVEVRL